MVKWLHNLTNYCQLCRNWIAINDGQQFDGTAAAATASSGCRHVYCRECLAQYLDSQITNGTVHHIKCPDRQSSGEAAYELVCKLLSRKSLVRYHKLLLIKTLDTIEDTAYCPKCNDSVEIDSSRKYGYCLDCDYAFCACCRLGYHGSQSACSIGTGATDKDVQPGDKQRRLVNGNSGRSPDGLHESVNFIRAHYKKCPNCGFTCEKINGCNNMQCKMCMIHFCWLCLMDITNNETRVIHYLTTNCKLNTI
ncbi:E3 ubiquitin-protein ligase RNF14-like [Oppia nitens]|uniref:E3 ubiquitin-protein ligase RNF14-like n=1 Tax=Oppia nitens TaxID=1686743 RepID=UPI0023DB1A36|nr:E3 ubiquitin-protein ligase RNF14-like [Oppia nitens]